MSMDPYYTYRRNSRGPFLDPPAKVHPKIMFGPGSYLRDDFIQRNNITHVINCASRDAVPTYITKRLGERYVELNAIDDSKVDITDWYPLFQQAMDTFIRTSYCGTIYVNCQAGMNRSGFLTLLYSCMKLGYEYESAKRAILMQRPCALMNSYFDVQVHEYIKKHR